MTNIILEYKSEKVLTIELDGRRYFAVSFIYRRAGIPAFRGKQVMGIICACPDINLRKNDTESYLTAEDWGKVFPLLAHIKGCNYKELLHWMHYGPWKTKEVFNGPINIVRRWEDDYYDPDKCLDPSGIIWPAMSPNQILNLKWKRPLGTPHKAVG